MYNHEYKIIVISARELIYFFTYTYFCISMFAGIFMMVGQILEAVVTPLVGYETDRTKGFWNYGHRKSWHLLGRSSDIHSLHRSAK